MFVSILCFFLLLYAIRGNERGNKVTSIFIFLLFLSAGFGFFHEDWLYGAPINKYYDFAIFYIFYVLLRYRNTSFFSNAIYRLFGLLTLFSTISFVFTIVMGTEIFSFSLKTYRVYLLYLSFVVFRGLNKQELKKLLYLTCLSTVIASIVYVTQPLHKLPILDRMVVIDDFSLSNGEYVRYRNIPELLYFVTCFALIVFRLSDIRSVMLVALCGISIVLTQHRAVMLGFLAIVGIYLLISRQMGKLVQYSVLGLVAFASVGSMIVTRFSVEKGKEGTTTFEDIENVFTMDYSTAALSGYDDEGGTFAFRVLLFIERFDYFVQHPQYMLTGVGMRHADSPYTERDFSFILGSKKLNKDTGIWEPAQITSSDLVWFTPFMRFGLLGLFFYIFITWRMLIFFYKSKDYGIVTMSAFLYYVFLIIISMKNDMLFASKQLALLFLLIELIDKTNVKDTKECYTFLDFNIINLKEKIPSKIFNNGN